MATKAEEYRVRAADCEQKAHEALDTYAREQYSITAKTWRRLAEIAERHRWYD
jgi:hypothetical protein